MGKHLLQLHNLPHTDIGYKINHLPTVKYKGQGSMCNIHGGFLHSPLMDLGL